MPEFATNYLKYKLKQAEASINSSAKEYSPIREIGYF